MRWFTSLFVSLIVMAGCSQDPPEAQDLSGPRFPDDQGIVTQIDFENVELDNKSTYRISREVQSFSTYSTDIVVPLLQRKNEYVHLGLSDDNLVSWISGVGSPFHLDSVVVYYIGDMVRMDEDRNAVFFDGTVLRLAGDVAPLIKQRVRATIDVASDLVVALEQQ